MKQNKLNEKQLTIIFCVIFVLLVGVYFLVQTSQTIPPSVSPVTKRAVSVPPSLTEEEKQLLEEVRQAKPAPLSQVEEAMLQQVRSSKLESLTEGEEATIRKMRGI